MRQSEQALNSFRNPQPEYAMARTYGSGAYPRRPLLPLGAKDGEAFWEKLVEMMELEASLTPDESTHIPSVTTTI
jgi:hypothetical protein